MKKILVTGSAGFIGYHLTKQLLKRNYKVVGIDSLNTYYDRNLKISRNKDLKLYAKKNKKKFYFYKLNITNRRLISDLFYKYKFYKVFHMAAQPGVRYSFEEPYKYIESNLVGFFNILQNITYKPLLSYSGCFGEDLFVKNYFSEKKKGIYVDIGCNQPKLNSLTFLLYKEGWNGINVDISERCIKLYNFFRKNH